MKNRIIILLTTLLLIVGTVHIVPSTYIGAIHPRGIYITYDTGIMLNEDGDGQLTTEYVDDYYNYICYNPQEFHVGDNITTICLYNPLTIWGDDIVFRYDIRR